MTEKESSAAITEAEAALYDRQIRLWGLDAQKRWTNNQQMKCLESIFIFAFPFGFALFFSIINMPNNL